MSPRRPINGLSLRSHMDMEQPTGPEGTSEPPADAEVAERKPSKVAVFVAMAAVAIAILIVMLAPGAETPSAPASAAKGNLTGSPNTAEEDAAADAKAAGKPAPLDFTLKDMNGVDVKLASF